MRKIFAIFILFKYLSIQFIVAQVTAGQIPFGTSSSNPNINLMVDVGFTDTIGFFDIDCDSLNDMSIHLYKSATMVDGTNYAALIVQNSSFEICSDTSSINKSVNYFNQGDLLNYPAGYQWSSDSSYFLGCYGMWCEGIDSVNNLYIAYRKDTMQIGWIKISFNLNDYGNFTAPITLAINEILSLCSSSYVSETHLSSDLYLYPNPAAGTVTIHWSQSNENSCVNIYSFSGQCIYYKQTETENSVSIDVSTYPKGVYFIKMVGKEFVETRKLIVQ